ncbi:MAG: ABC transporter ATP-binding protein/permease [Clostridiales bacterium]|nr:ABC transporter ATP-binding protein/permease [Clostridiales bacterium]
MAKKDKYAGSGMKKQKFSVVVKRIWKMASPYWTKSEEKWASIGLLVVSLLMMILSTMVTRRMVIWNKDWMNAFNNRDAQLWMQQIGVFLIVGVAMVFSGTFNTYITSWIQVRWKRWMTSYYMDLWLSNNTHYKMQVTGSETDNPDQRISEDIIQFITYTWTYTFSFVQNLLTMGTYLVMLWDLSATIPLIIGGVDISFPGYFIVIAIVYAAITTLISHIFGKQLSRLNYNQQMYDANFRYSLVRIRECSEQIALLNGEEVEHARAMSIFGDSVLNTFRTMNRTLKHGMVTTTLAYADAMMFTFLLGPAYFFHGAMDGYGTFMQVATAFQNVVNSFKWFYTNYTGLAIYIAVIDRLYAFNEIYERTEAIVNESKLKRTENDKGEIEVKDLDVYLPTGHLQISAKDLVITQGEKILIKGRSGAGKTTLFRVLAGIWPYADGNISLPADKKVIVLPQKPYFPIGTLIEAVSYPMPAGTYTREEIRQALVDVGMPQLVDRLDEVAHWNMILSGGEQQRLGIARAMLYDPDFLFFDEATASLDEKSEAELYSMILERMKKTTLISIGHRSSLQQYHSRVIMAEHAAKPGSFEFVETAAEASYT